ncbi:GTP cyclohydrolase I [Chloroflexi bacterium TSY]|nr:GTP cyclohydrolase I [Chloroflexi bacterium TSY]
MIGLGKLTRLIKTVARKPQLQEKFTQEIATSLQQALNPQGVAVHITAKHLCEAMRGMREENQIFSTFSMKGVFKSDLNLQAIFMSQATKLES